MNILGQRNLTRRRYATGSWSTGGTFVPGVLSTLTFKGSDQPLDGDDLQSLDEGDRSRRTRKVYTTMELRTAQATNADAGSPPVSADEVVIGSTIFEVRRVERERAVLPHYKAILVAQRES